jgi:hypothetical protein
LTIVLRESNYFQCLCISVQDQRDRSGSHGSLYFY